MQMKYPLVTMNQLQAAIIARRRALNLSQQEVAAKLGISQSYLSDVESGKRRLSVQRLLDLANLLNLQLLLEDKRSSSHEP